MLKRWQAQIEISDLDEDSNIEYQTVCVYSETADALPEAARTYLLAKKPRVGFSNVGDHIIGQFIYFDAEQLASETFQGEPLDRFWWRRERHMIRGQIQESSDIRPEQMASFEDAVEDFVINTLIPEKGPDYESRAIVGNQFRLPLLEKVLREGEEYLTNDLIQRGWHIVALEYKGETSVTGELLNRKAIFVMGHPEAHAAKFTLHACYYTTAIDRQK